MKHRWWWAYDPIALGETIRELRQDRALQQSELAERVGVSRMTISRMEHGQAVATETALRALAECGYTVVVVPKFAHVRVTK